MKNGPRFALGDLGAPLLPFAMIGLGMGRRKS